jgi:hypothetical protein
MFDPIRPISPSDRSVPPVDLTILTPLEREQEKQRRERERRRRAQSRPNDPAADGPGGIDIRV